MSGAIPPPVNAKWHKRDPPQQPWRQCQHQRHHQQGLPARYRFDAAQLWGILISFIALNSLMLALEIFYVPLVPAVLLFLALALVSMDKYLLLIVFFVPVSVPLSRLVEGLSIDMYLPTEPLLAGLLLLYLLKYLMG